VLDIVEDEQRLTVPQRIRQASERREVILFADAQALQDAVADERGIRDRGEGRQHRAILELVGQVRAQLECQSRLADAAGAAQGEEGDVGSQDEPAGFREFAFSAHQGGAGKGKSRRAVGKGSRVHGMLAGRDEETPPNDEEPPAPRQPAGTGEDGRQRRNTTTESV
jgi:hypothetical protein